MQDQSASLHQFPEKKPEVRFTFCNFFSWSPKVPKSIFIILHQKTKPQGFGECRSCRWASERPRTNSTKRNKRESKYEEHRWDVCGMKTPESQKEKYIFTCLRLSAYVDTVTLFRFWTIQHKYIRQSLEFQWNSTQPASYRFYLQLTAVAERIGLSSKSAAERWAKHVSAVDKTLGDLS